VDETHGVIIVKASCRWSLEDLVRRARPLLVAAGAERAVVFGSYARGTADGYSDLDLAVVIETDRPFVERGALLGGLFDALSVPVDLLVYTPEEFARGLSARVGVFDAIAREGVTIHVRP